MAIFVFICIPTTLGIQKEDGKNHFTALFLQLTKIITHGIGLSDIHDFCWFSEK